MSHFQVTILLAAGFSLIVGIGTAYAIAVHKTWDEPPLPKSYSFGRMTRKLP